MGQAKRRGSYEDRLAQALVANATLEKEVLTSPSLDLDVVKSLEFYMHVYGVQKFRMSVGRHLGKETT